jgi:hypothetical protein
MRLYISKRNTDLKSALDTAELLQSAYHQPVFLDISEENYIISIK